MIFPPVFKKNIFSIYLFFFFFTCLQKQAFIYNIIKFQIQTFSLTCMSSGFAVILGTLTTKTIKNTHLLLKTNRCLFMLNHQSLTVFCHCTVSIS